MASPEEDKFLDPHGFTRSGGSQDFFDPYDMEETDNVTQRQEYISKSKRLNHIMLKKGILNGSKNSDNSLRGQRPEEFSVSSSDYKSTTSKTYSFTTSNDSFKSAKGSSPSITYEAQPFTDSSSGVISVEASGESSQSFADGEFHDDLLIRNGENRTDPGVRVYSGVIAVEASGESTQSFPDGEFPDDYLIRNGEKPRSETDVRVYSDVISVEASGEATQSFPEDYLIRNGGKPRSETGATIFLDCVPPTPPLTTSPCTMYPLNPITTDNQDKHSRKAFKPAALTTTTPFASPRKTSHAPYVSPRTKPEKFHDMKELNDGKTTNSCYGRRLAHVQHGDVHTLPSSSGPSKEIHYYDSSLLLGRDGGSSNQSYARGDARTIHERTSGGYIIDSDGEDDHSSHSSNDERTPLMTNRQPTVYKRRWYVLAVFCLINALQALGWGTWGPITQSAKSVFGWSDANIALLTLWGNLAYVFFSVPICFLVEKKGLRFSIITSVALQAAGFGLRCITSAVPLATWLINIGQIFLGAGAIAPYSAVSLFSVTWFPVTQRTTATSLATLFTFVGISLGFIIGPIVVPEPADGLNGTENASEIARQESAIMNYMYMEAGAAAFILLLVLIYFPSRPPSPPSITAHIERLQLKEGLKHLARSKNFLLVLLSFCVGTGVYGSFCFILDIDVQPLGVSQKTAGWMGFYGSIGGCFAGFVFSWISDKFPRHLKLMLMIMLVPALATLIWFLLMVGQYIEHDTGSLYVTTIVPGVMIFGSTPLFYELACEASYPADEGVTTLVMTVINNFAGSVFLAILLVPNIGVTWMNWFLVASVVVCTVLLLVSRVQYHRTNIDMEVISPEMEGSTSDVPQ